MPHAVCIAAIVAAAAPAAAARRGVGGAADAGPPGRRGRRRAAAAAADALVLDLDALARTALGAAPARARRAAALGRRRAPARLPPGRARRRRCAPPARGRARRPAARRPHTCLSAARRATTARGRGARDRPRAHRRPRGRARAGAVLAVQLAGLRASRRLRDGRVDAKWVPEARARCCRTPPRAVLRRGRGVPRRRHGVGDGTEAAAAAAATRRSRRAARPRPAPRTRAFRVNWPEPADPGPTRRKAVRGGPRSCPPVASASSRWRSAVTCFCSDWNARCAPSRSWP